MRRLRPVLISLLVLGFTPGAGELLSDGVHLVMDGHTAHAAEHARAGGTEHAGHGHDSPDPEHGCNGWLHTCACHSSLSVIALVDAWLPRAIADGVSMWAARRDHGAVGVSSGIERPPRV